MTNRRRWRAFTLTNPVVDHGPQLATQHSWSVTELAYPPRHRPRPNADADERAGTALFAVSVRSIGRVGRATDKLRYLYAASPLQRLLQFYPEPRGMARLSLHANASLVPERSGGTKLARVVPRTFWR